MVDLMDVLVEWAPMEGTMRPVMPGVFQHEENSNLVPTYRSVLNDPCHEWYFANGTLQHCEERGERYAGIKPEILSHWVEEPNKINELPTPMEKWTNEAYHI